MKKLIIAFITVIIVTTTTFPVHGSSNKSNSPNSLDQKKLNDLSQRFAYLESSWGRFQLGGNLSLESGTSFNDLHSEDLPVLTFKQNLNLSLDAFIDQNLNFSLKMSHSGIWGDQLVNQMEFSPELSEALLRLEYPDFVAYLGRFPYSVTPLGLISDFLNGEDYVEGIALQKKINNYQLMGLYNRLNIGQLEENGPLVSENYFVGRFSWSNQLNTFGLTLLPDGMSGEKCYSLDWSINSPDSKLTVEYGWYSFNNPEFPDYRVDDSSGILLSYGKIISPKTFMQVKFAYIDPEFTPRYSSLAYNSGDNREWFVNNSKGMELFFQNELKPSLYLENRFLYYKPLTVIQPDSNYRLRSVLIKNFSPVNSLQFGIDLRDGAITNRQIFVNWNLRF